MRGALAAVREDEGCSLSLRGRKRLGLDQWCYDPDMCCDPEDNRQCSLAWKSSFRSDLSWAPPDVGFTLTMLHCI